jgi:hypothetical protein
MFQDSNAPTIRGVNPDEIDNEDSRAALGNGGFFFRGGNGLQIEGMIVDL